MINLIVASIVAFLAGVIGPSLFGLEPFSRVEFFVMGFSFWIIGEIRDIKKIL